MRKTFWLLLFVGISVFIYSCKKDTDNTDVKNDLVFTNLNITNDTIAVGDFTTLKALATGDDLIYTWVSESGFGTFVGSGAEVSWSVCHASDFVVSCEVSDKYNQKVKKSVNIHVHD